MTRATKVKGLPINREPFAEFLHGFSDRATGRSRSPKDRHCDCIALSALIICEPQSSRPHGPALRSVGPFGPFPHFVLGPRALSETQVDRQGAKSSGVDKGGRGAYLAKPIAWAGSSFEALFAG